MTANHEPGLVSQGNVDEAVRKLESQTMFVACTIHDERWHNDLQLFVVRGMHQSEGKECINRRRLPVQPEAQRRTSTQSPRSHSHRSN